MPEDINLQELESLVTTRVVCDRLKVPKTTQYKSKYAYAEALRQCMFAVDDILIERELNKSFWARIRGNRLYIFYLPLNRIAIEAGVVTDELSDGARNNFRMQLVGYRGKFPPKTLSELVRILEKSSRRYNERKKYGV